VNRNSAFNWALVDEVTIRTLEFLMIVSENRVFRAPLVLSIIHLLRELLNRYQSKSNYELILGVLSRIIQPHQEGFFHQYHVYSRAVVALGLDLVTRQLQVAKAAGCALLLHLLYTDFSFTQQAIITSYYFEQQAMECLWECPAYKRERLVAFLVHFDTFAELFADRQFVALARQRRESFESLLQIITEKSITGIETGLAAMSNLFVSSPLQLLHWLEKGVDVAVEQLQAAKAFEFQIKRVYIIRTTLAELHTDVPFDFAAFNVPNWKVDLSSYSEKSIKVASKYGDLSIKGFKKAVDKAIDLAKRANLAGEARQLSLQCKALQ
jgi:hypothetical protein